MYRRIFTCRATCYRILYGGRSVLLFARVLWFKLGLPSLNVS